MQRFLALSSLLAVWMLWGMPGYAAAASPGQPVSYLSWIAQGRSQEHRGHGAEKAKEGKDHAQGHYEGKGGDSKARFSSHERRIIRDYFLQNTSSLPPGLAKRGNLPPGLERQLRERGTLPPGLQKRVQPFPVELARRLPPLPEGYSRVILGGRALVLNRRHVIIDIMFLFR